MKKLFQYTRLGLILILGGAHIAFGQTNLDSVSCGGDGRAPKVNVTHSKKQRGNEISQKNAVGLDRLYPAKVAKLQGRVFLIERDGHQTEQLLSVGSSLQLNDVVQTADQSFVSIRLGDGTLSMMPSSSRVKLLRGSSTAARFALQQGEIHNKVVKSPKANKNTFEIQLPSSMIGVRGTEFSVRTLPQNTAVGAVTVESGTVWVRSRASCQAPLILSAGQGALTSDVSGQPLLMAPELINPDKTQSANYLQFVMQPVAGATRYRAQMMGDDTDLETVAEAFADKPDVTMNAVHLQNGFYYVRLSAYNAAGIEGVSRKYLFLHNFNGVDR